MDVDFRRWAVSVVGFSMAVVGFFLKSVTVPVITAVLPQLKRQTPQDAHGRAHRRIQPRTSRQLRQQESSPTVPHAVASETGSADSLESSNTIPSVLSSSHHAPSTIPSLPSNSPEAPLQRLPSASRAPVPHEKREHGCNSPVQHVCTPQKCTERATTSASDSASAPQENAGKRTKSKSNDRDGVRESNARPLRVVSWLKASPPSSLLHPQPTPRSSGESSRAPALVLPPRASTFDQDAFEQHPQNRLAPRRASTLFSFRRTSKAPVHAGRESTPASPTMLTMTPMPMPIAEGRRSEPASPSPSLHDLHEAPSEAGRTDHGRKRKLSYFARLKRKHRGEDKANSTQLYSEPEHEPDVSANHSPHASERGRPRENRHRVCERHRRPATAPTVPPPRTNPYEAPYFFPSPTSPEAVDYVQRTLTEYRRTSTGPSSATRTPYRNEPGSIPPPSLAAAPGSGSTGQAMSTLPLSRTNDPTPQSAPAHHVNFVPSAPGRHRKSASASATSPTVDEFGFVFYPPAQASSQMISPGSARDTRSVLKRASLAT